MSASQTAVSAVQPVKTGNAGPSRRSQIFGTGWGRSLLGVVSVLAGILIWQLLSMRLPPLFLPSPVATFQSSIELWQDGTLIQAIIASLGRIMVGWGFGVIIGVPVGILMGHFRWVRQLLDPYIEFFRFIPPIAFVTLAVIWLGPGESSKVALIFYTTVFTIIINMIAGVQAVSEIRLRAAASLGAGPLRTLLTVIVPSTVPYMVTGARMAMGNSFLTIVSAEIVAAQEGLGALIWMARNYARTEWVFVGIIILGLLGYACDRVLRFAAMRLLKRYAVAV
jgi:ABC-type nitrate/sulfonate/bicarbonate transport system permease component